MLTSNNMDFILSNDQIDIPSWYRLCIGIDLSTYKITSSVNGKINSTAVTAKSISDPTKSLSSTKIMIIAELFSEFHIYSKPINLTVPSSSGDLLAWNISEWEKDSMARDSTVSKADIDSPRGTQYLAVKSDLNFKEAVSDKITFFVFTLNTLFCFLLKVKCHKKSCSTKPLGRGIRP